MTIIREVVTRFGFEVDEKGAKGIEKRVDGMKKGFGGLGKFIGVALAGTGAKALFGMGQSIDRARFSAERFSGIKLNKLQAEFRATQKELDSIKKGAGEIVTEKEFLVAAAGFTKVFGKGEKQFSTFKDIFAFAAKQASLTGQSVNSIFEQIQGGITGGGFDALLDVPGFDIFKKKMLEFQQQVIDPGEPGGRIALANRLKAISQVITESSSEQEAALKTLPDNIFEADRAAAQTKNTFENLAGSINNVLVPAMKGLNVVMGRFNELIEIGKRSDSAGDAVKNILNEIINPAEKPQIVAQTVAASVFPGSQQTTRAGDTISFTNTFHINDMPDGKAFGEQMISVFSNQISNAKKSIVKTEE